MPVVLAGLLSLINVKFGFLLFHTFAELFAVCIGILMFVVAWSTYSYIRNNFLLFLGIGYFWVAVVDLLHALTYKGLPFFDLSSQATLHFWVYARFLEAAILVSAPIFYKCYFNRFAIMTVGGLIAAVIAYASLYFEQPIFFIEGKGLTTAKVISEYFIISMLMVAMVIYWHSRYAISKRVRFFILWSLIFTIAAEFSFTQYADFYGVSNQVGHIFKLFSFWMIYEAIIRTTLKRPFSVMSLAAHSYDAVPYPAVYADSSGIIRQANKSASQAYDLQHNEPHLHAETHVKDQAEANCEICQHLSAGTEMRPAVIQYPELNAWKLISLTPLKVGNRLSGFIQISTDVTEQIEAKTELQLSSAIISRLAEGIMVLDPKLNIMSINQTFTEITGYSEEDIINQKANILSSGHHDDAFYKTMWARLKTEDRWQGEILNRRKNGEVYPELLSISTLRDKQGDVTHYIGAFSDITKIKGVESQLDFLAHHDALTGLPNKLLFINLLNESIKRSKRVNSKSGLLFVDLDDFKNINESLGHSVGDIVLVNVAQRLSRLLRENDIISRCGGDEFLILIEDIKSADDLSSISEKLIDCLETPVHHHDGLPLFIGASIGITIYPDDAETSERLIQFADTAMYKSKFGGKNNFNFHAESDNHEATRRLKVESKLRLALENQEFHVVYQPKIDVRTYRVVGAEALVRWRNEDLGDIYPDEFIPLAESIGIIHELGKFVLAEALKEVVKWRELTQGDLSIAVNFSSRQFTRNGLDEMIAAQLKSFNLPGSALEVEITESLLLSRNQLVTDTLLAISDMQVSIAIDDFGTGFSSLSYLKNYPIDVVKIDKSFIDNVYKEPEDAVLVKTIILMAHGLGMSVVAEGIEDQRQLSFYQREKGDLAQGYYISQPKSPDDFIAFLNAWQVNKSQYMSENTNIGGIQSSDEMTELPIGTKT